MQSWYKKESDKDGVFLRENLWLPYFLSINSII